MRPIPVRGLVAIVAVLIAALLSTERSAAGASKVGRKAAVEHASRQSDIREPGQRVPLRFEELSRQCRRLPLWLRHSGCGRSIRPRLRSDRRLSRLVPRGRRPLCPRIRGDGNAAHSGRRWVIHPRFWRDGGCRGAQRVQGGTYIPGYGVR